MRIVAILFLALVPCFAFAESESDCLHLVDYSARFGPIRNQDGHGYCWAFTSAALVEEENCLEDKSLCGQSVSPLDVSYCSFSFAGNPGLEGGRPYDALACARRQGVCLEKDAPYALSSKTLDCWALRTLGDGTCENQHLINIFQRYQSSHSANLDQDLRSVRAIAPDSEKAGVDLKKAFESSTSGSNFLRSILVGPQCRQNRLRPQAEIHPDARYFNGETDDQKLRALKSILQNGRSVAAGVCLEKIAWRDWIETAFDAATCKAAHSLVINGMRWNSERQRCEVRLRNSWGEGTTYNGWYSAQQILHGTTDLTFFKLTK